MISKNAMYIFIQALTLKKAREYISQSANLVGG
jgi:hypothetical protein